MFVPMNQTLLQSVMLRAMDAAREGITISDARLPDQPLIYVNDGFLQMTGYAREEIIGRNCRFLQGGQSNPEAVKAIRAALVEQKPVQVELLNYSKNGSPFWNRLSITPVFGTDGMLTHFIGVQDNITVEKEKQRVEQELAERELTVKVTLEAQERERRELSKELHDNVNQMLAATALYLGQAFDREDVRLSMIQQSKGLLREAMQELRKLSQALGGPALKHCTLNETLASLVIGLRPVAPFQIHLQLDDMDDEALSENKKVMFYRIVQEQLNNTVKYAKAGHVFIRLWASAGSVYLSIKDDGIGFDKGLSREGIGLQNIRARVRMEQGNMRLVTAPGRGCELVAEVPLSVAQ